MYHYVYNDCSVSSVQLSVSHLVHWMRCITCDGVGVLWVVFLMRIVKVSCSSSIWSLLVNVGLGVLHAFIDEVSEAGDTLEAERDSSW